MEIEAIYEWLIDHDPVDPGAKIAYRVHLGRRVRVGRFAIHVPTTNDDYEAYGVLQGGKLFRDRYAQPAETYIDALGRSLDGREALEKFGVLAGVDCIRAVTAFLRDAEPFLGTGAILQTGILYGLRRGEIAEILGKRVIVKRMGRSIKLEVNKNG